MNIILIMLERDRRYVMTVGRIGFVFYFYFSYKKEITDSSKLSFDSFKASCMQGTSFYITINLHYLRSLRTKDSAIAVRCN